MDVLAGCGTWTVSTNGFRSFGEMAERSKALDWNSSNIFTGVPGFESLSLRHK
jgi:hypothetical protein